ncbi:MAG TPA: MotA/TolQ/ExbB proton channel family protein [Pyrinomonadaceae bacterium]|nr:MotA/TolQ/ExbB proton channel family protein [Pyrinomonadaceae bacterium]
MKRLDLTVLVGLLVGLVAIVGSALLEGIRPGFLWQPTAFLVVIGGTTGAVIIRRGLGGVRSALRATLSLFVRDSHEEAEATLARLAWIARAAKREGVKAFENHALYSRDLLVSSTLKMAAEYAEPAAVRANLDRVLDVEDEEGRRDSATLDAAGGFAPTFGILGAVLGLIHVLRLLDQPGALGTGIATAFVATIYGVGVANLLFFPLAARLRERHELRMREREALADALVALAAHESPVVISRHFNERIAALQATSNIASVRMGAR